MENLDNMTNSNAPFSKKRPAHRPSLGLYPEYRRDLLARAVGMHPISLTRILRGYQKPKPEVVSKLASIFGVTDEALVTALAMESQARVTNKMFE